MEKSPNKALFLFRTNTAQQLGFQCSKGAVNWIAAVFEAFKNIQTPIWAVHTNEHLFTN
jgi:hypothetical protein